MKDWYLMQSPVLTSGDENDLLSEFGDDAIAELLASGIAQHVQVLNYDLSESKDSMAIIVGNAQDTKLKSLNRQVIFPIGTCKAGMYVLYRGRYWLVVGLVDSNVIYEKAIMTLCNYVVTWVNSNGKIIQRWANIVSASQYNNGETGEKFYRVRSDQLLVALPNDDESLMIDSGIRFVIDKRCKIYEKNFTNDVTCDTSKPLFVYELTRSDTVLYDYQDSGHSEFLATQDEQRNTDGYYVVDGKGYWLATVPPSIANTALCSIEPLQDSVLVGVEAAVYLARFYDLDGNELAGIAPTWIIDCDFKEKLDVQYVDNSILISTNSKSLLNKSFKLSLSADGFETTTIDVPIVFL